jgi:hypothetical protein
MHISTQVSKHNYTMRLGMIITNTTPGKRGIHLCLYSHIRALVHTVDITHYVQIM